MNLLESSVTRPRGQTRFLPWMGLLALLGSLLASCSSQSLTDQVKDVVETPANQSAPRLGVVVHGGLDHDGVKNTVHQIIENQVNARGSLGIQVMGSDGSAATMTKLEIGEQGFLGGREETADENEQKRIEYKAEAESLVDQALDFEPDETGLADLLQALVRAVEAAERLDGRGNRRAILVTGGGVHRTTSLDFYAELQPADWAPTVAEIVKQIGDTEVSIEIVGVAQFASGANPDLQLTSRVNQLWDDVCQALGENQINCTPLKSHL